MREDVYPLPARLAAIEMGMKDEILNKEVIRMRRLIVAGLLSLGILVGSAGTALATHCYVADKPAGAGTNGAFVTEEGGDLFKSDLPEPAHERGTQTHGVLEVEE
jgi:hypothetical protein